MPGYNGEEKMATSFDTDIEKIFPNIRAYGYTVTSPDSTLYNCIAWAVEDNTRWWWPDPMMMYYWPHDVPREETIDAFIRLFESIGYTTCKDGDYETGYQKISVYVDRNGTPTHAARQLNNGKWTSKLGRLKDIEHNNEDAFRASDYGIVGVYLRKKSKQHGRI